MRAQRWTRRVLILGQFMVLLLSPLSESAWPETYDSMVAMLHDPDSSVQIEGKERLALIIKKNLLKSELHYGSDQFTEDTFLFGHFINPNALDLAIGISVPAPGQGNLVVLTLKNGPYVPVEPVTGIGLIESLEAVKLFPGPLDQLVLDMVGGGTGWRHWGKDIYRWDGKAMRLIWAWVRKEVYEKWLPVPREEITGHIVRSEINLGDLKVEGGRDTITSDTIEEGVFADVSWELGRVVSRRETKVIHKWDESLFYYVPSHGEIKPPGVTGQCRKGIPGKVESETIPGERKVGIVEIPGHLKPRAEVYHAVIGKENFCEIPKSAVKLLD